jgi:phosphohistidine phosphatase
MFAQKVATLYFTTTGLRLSCLPRIVSTHPVRTMMTRSNDGVTSSTGSAQPEQHHTTNDEDQRAVKKLQARLRNAVSNAKVGQQPVPSVEIAEGVHKYVLIKAEINGDEQHIVTSKKGAAYHRNAAEPMITKLEQAGYSNIEVTGGGRVSLDSIAKQIYIFGFSYGFGLADHSISQRIVLEDPRYRNFEVTFSDEGY